MSATAQLIVGLTVIATVVKIAGPVLLGGRTMPAAFTSVVALTAPALLAALVVTSALADGHHLSVGANTAGVAAGGLVAWRTESAFAAVVVGAALTAALRAV